MRWLIVACIVLVCAQYGASTTWTASYDAGTGLVQVTREGAGVVALSSDDASHWSGPVSGPFLAGDLVPVPTFDRRDAAQNASAVLPDRITANDTVLPSAVLSARVRMTALQSTRPYVHWTLTARTAPETSLWCAALPFFSTNTVNCTFWGSRLVSGVPTLVGNSSTPAVLSAVVVDYDDTGDTLRSVTASLTMDDTDTLTGVDWDGEADEAGLVAVVLYRVVGHTQRVGALREAEARNQERADNNATMIGVVYGLVAFGMTACCVFCATWMTWVQPRFRSAPLFWWSMVIGGWAHGLSWMGGFGAWLAVMGVMTLVALIMPFLYMWIRWRQRRRLRQSSPSPSPSLSQSDSLSGSGTSEQQEAASSGSREEVSGDASERGTVLGEAGWSFPRHPQSLSRKQMGWLVVMFLLMLCVVSVCLIIYNVWKVNTYLVLDRQTQQLFVEFQPQVISKTLATMYAFEGMASTWRFDWLLQLQSRACGIFFTRTLDHDDKLQQIQRNFIDKYNIDMSIFNRTEFWQFNSVNDWFIRKLANGVRPLSHPQDTAAIASVADCRLTVFTDVTHDVNFWLKGREFSVYSLLDGRGEHIARFAGGSLAIFRLAPADYHRIHAPMSGTIIDQYKVESTLYSVNADAIRSGSGAIVNERLVTIIQDTARPHRQIAFVAIGATCVGSVSFYKASGQTIQIGEDVGNFQFGGSTVAVLFPPGQMVFDDDLLQATTSFSVETLVQVRSSIGRWLAP